MDRQAQKRKPSPQDASILRQALRRGFMHAPLATSGAPHLRSESNVHSLLNRYVLASLPALAIGTWAAGSAAIAAQGGGIALSSWQAAARDLFEPAAAGWLQTTALGALLLAPPMLVALGVALLWELVFAARRERPIDAGWIMMAWLYALLLPPATPLYLVALGLSFGAVFGKHIFGGTGRYLVSPALLGVVFLEVAYPTWVPGQAANAGWPSTWSQVAAGGLESLGTRNWPSVFLGDETGTFGGVSAAACLLGAAYLWLRGAASLRIVVAGIAGLAIAALGIGALGNDEVLLGLPWHWHLALGSFAFTLAFLATDPTTTPTTPAGRWAFGGLAGALTVCTRELAPTHADGALSAVLLASLCVPLIDHVIVRWHIARQRRRSTVA